ncbi:hypothetical protein GCM10010372_43980 [Streptomyces tauricus]|nr:hypothetical protein GCM10010372_43980 [Streptomyces tauricus]
MRTRDHGYAESRRGTTGRAVPSDWLEDSGLVQERDDPPEVDEAEPSSTLRAVPDDASAVHWVALPCGLLAEGRDGGLC